jgi:hypothetical protein
LKSQEFWSSSSSDSNCQHHSTQMNVVLLIFLILSFFSVLFLLFGYFDAFVASVQDNECHSIQEDEDYVELAVGQPKGPSRGYKLYYSNPPAKKITKINDDDDENEIRLVGIPILFLPGKFSIRFYYYYFGLLLSTLLF